MLRMRRSIRLLSINWRWRFLAMRCWRWWWPSISCSAEPDAGVGRLTARRAALVADETLAQWAAAFELGPLLRLGRGAEQGGGRETVSILATTMEAVLGALYEEAGLVGVRRVVGGLAGWSCEGGVTPVLG